MLPLLLSLKYASGKNATTIVFPHKYRDIFRS